MAAFVPMGTARAWQPMGRPLTTVLAGANDVATDDGRDVGPRNEPASVSETEPTTADSDAYGADLATECIRKEADREMEHAAALAEVERLQAREKAAADRLAAVTADFVRQRDVALGELRAHAAELILAGARKIAGEALRVDPALLTAMIAEAVDALGTTGLTMRVAERDAERVRGIVAVGVLVEADASISGGCVALGPSGSIDASFERAADAVSAAVRAWK